MVTNPHVLEFLPAYAVGSLDEDERLLVLEHLAACSVCAAELLAYQAVTDQLALAAPDASPPPDLKRRLMARLPGPRANEFDQPRRWWQPKPLLTWRPALVWGIVSFCLILVLAASNFILWQRINQLETVLYSKGMRAVALSSTGLVPAAAGFVIISADGQEGAFVVDALPLLDENKQQYQLWLIQDDQRNSGAVFSVDAHGYGGGRIRAPKNLHAYSGCDASIEPKGGSSSPTGEKVLVGNLK